MKMNFRKILITVWIGLAMVCRVVSYKAYGEDPVHYSTVEDDEHDHDEHAGHDHDVHRETSASADDHENHDDERYALVFSPEVLDEFGIEVSSAGGGILDTYVTLPGEVQVNQDRLAHIVPRYPGLVIEVGKHIGDSVMKGEILAILESNESLAPYKLKSLIDGVIIEKHITLGESLNEGDVAFLVADLESVWVDLAVYQKDLFSIRKGQEVFISAGHVREPRLGLISYVSPTLDEHTRTGHARVILANKQHQWRPGLFVTGQVSVQKIEVPVLIPKTALQTLNGKVSIFVASPKGFIPREVVLGRKNSMNVEILSGLTFGEQYVSSGGFTLKAELARSSLEHAGHAH